MYLSLTSPSKSGSFTPSVSLFTLCVCVCDLSCLQAELVENFIKDTCLFRVLSAQPSKQRGEDVRLLTCYT